MASEAKGRGAAPLRTVALRRVLRRVSRCFHACLDRACDCMDVLLRLVGPVSVAFALALFGIEGYAFFAVVLPEMAAEEVGLAARLLLGSTGAFLLVNLVYNYLMAICVDPGLPPAYDDGADAALEADGAAPRQCHKCLRLKPPRAHHCSVCKRCVLKMDHHCPWINNCVGFHNYRYFCLFLFYLAACCLFVVVAFWRAFWGGLVHGLARAALPEQRNGGYDFVGHTLISLSWILAAGIFFAISMLGCFHAYLVLTNQTTIEFHGGAAGHDVTYRKGERYRRPYDLGRKRNFQQVFGPGAVLRLAWLLPCVAARPRGDGLSFPSATAFRT